MVSNCVGVSPSRSRKISSIWWFNIITSWRHQSLGHLGIYFVGLMFNSWMGCTERRGIASIFKVVVRHHQDGGAPPAGGSPLSWGTASHHTWRNIWRRCVYTRKWHTVTHSCILWIWISNSPRVTVNPLLLPPRESYWLNFRRIKCHTEKIKTGKPHTLPRQQPASHLIKSE